MLIKSSTSDEEAKRLLRENGRASEFPSSSSSSIASFAESVIVTETRSRLKRVDSKVLKVQAQETERERTKVSFKGVLLLLLSKFAGCGHIVTTRLLLREGDFKPSALAVFRNVVTIFFLGSLLVVQERKDLRHNLTQIRNEVFTYWRQVVLGAFGTFILQTFVMQSLKVIPATNLAVLSQLSPPFLFIISGFILRTEKPTLVKLVGMVAAVGGAVVIIDPTHFKADDSRATIGNTMCVGMALSYAIIVTVQKYLVANVPAAALQFTFTLYAFPFFVLLACILKAFDEVTFTLTSCCGAVFVGVCASLDYYFAFASLKYVSTLLVGLANSLLPLFVGVTTYFFGEKLGWKDLIGAIFILGGMITVISHGEPQQDRQEEAEEETELLDLHQIQEEDGV